MYKIKIEKYPNIILEDKQFSVIAENGLLSLMGYPELNPKLISNQNDAKVEIEPDPNLKYKYSRLSFEVDIIGQVEPTNESNVYLATPLKEDAKLKEFNAVVDKFKMQN